MTDKFDANDNSAFAARTFSQLSFRDTELMELRFIIPGSVTCQSHTKNQFAHIHAMEDGA